MTVREDREVAGPPAMALAALATAGENLGYTVHDVRSDPSALVMSSGWTLQGASLGFIVTARARRRPRGSTVSIDVTPRLGSVALNASRVELRRLVQELQVVMGAPKARIRRPQKSNPGGKPFGWRPALFGVAWAVLAVAGFGLAGGGWWWVPALASLVGASLLLLPRPAPAWTYAVLGCAILSLPFGLLGAIARRYALANELWQRTVNR